MIVSNKFEFENREISEFYDSKRSLCRKVNIDCSEIVEDFINQFGGSALLMLSKEYSINKMVNFIDSSGNSHEYLYHYAWLKNEKVYDPMLDYFNVEKEYYLYKVIECKLSEISVKECSDKNLKCYGGL